MRCLAISVVWKQLSIWDSPPTSTRVGWVHTDATAAAAAATDLFGSASKAAMRSLCLSLIIFYHAANI